MKKVILSALALSALSLNSCDKGDLPSSESSMSPSSLQTISANINGNLDLYRKFAKSFSIVANNAEVRNFVLSKVLEQANGDYEVLYMHIKDHVFNDQQTFEQKIISASNSTLTTAILNNDKLLSICMPVNIEKVTSSVVPSVVYGDDEDAATIPGFSPQQQVISVNNKVTPDDAYWVVRDNERYTIAGQLKAEMKDMLTGLGDATIIRDFDPPGTSRRGNNPLYPEIFKSYEIPDLGAIEGWLRGKPEIEVYVIGNKDNLGTDIDYFFLSSLERKNYGKGKIIGNRRVICIWTTANQGNSLQYKFYEEDGGNDYPERFSLKNMLSGGASFEFTSLEGGWHPRDESMGWNNINIDDPFTTLTAGTSSGPMNLINYTCSDN